MGISWTEEAKEIDGKSTTSGSHVTYRERDALPGIWLLLGWGDFLDSGAMFRIQNEDAEFRGILQS